MSQTATITVCRTSTGRAAVGLALKYGAELGRDVPILDSFLTNPSVSTVWDDMFAGHCAAYVSVADAVPAPGDDHRVRTQLQLDVNDADAETISAATLRRQTRNVPTSAGWIAADLQGSLTRATWLASVGGHLPDSGEALKTAVAALSTATEAYQKVMATAAPSGATADS